MQNVTKHANCFANASLPNTLADGVGAVEEECYLSQEEGEIRRAEAKGTAPHHRTVVDKAVPPRGTN